MGAETAALALPRPLRHWAEASFQAFIKPPGGPAVDFTCPAGEAALAGPDSVSWQVFRNPLALFIGGVAAVILELAEPRVRAGVWNHTSFRTDPVRRLQRTGLAAMVTVYGARSAAEAMIAGVRRAHQAVWGRTEAGLPYRADDPVLLDWVQATACFGFLTAYCRFVHALPMQEQDRFYAEAAPAALLYGAGGAPTSGAGMEAHFVAMRPRLEPSPVIFEFLDIMQRAPILPAGLRPAQRMMVRAAVAITPDWARDLLGLECRLRPWEAGALRSAGRLAERLLLESSPAVQACHRLGLPPGTLLRRQAGMAA
ncbi:oxygenase MpaB family protein [Roseomonas sp. E05]|uniref:oxygenase MpaB family protein n=1 Tax=Roseomonas sp. E05 TaxID=3046310 RepID=UPI0024BBE628|nr:oxygenase MpaB family protein [Roseomonas sp. E05]MDJ0391560.1 oxygenase MpaB family protein [Roseomonas sp. E05]